VSERAAWVALSVVPGLGPSRFRKLLEAYGNPTSALKAGPEALAREVALPASALSEIRGLAGRLEQVERELASLDEEGVQALTWQDEAYPARLLATSSPPPVLWWKSLRCSTQPEAAVAIVGSREVTEQALLEAYRIGQALADAGVSVVSGMAAGVDAAAHEGALAGLGPTVGVCGCGIVTALTRGRDGLAGRMAERGAICSELAPTAPLSPKMLFARNRIIAGLADAVIVVEARPEGGAMHTANCAREEGRPVLAVDWPDPAAASGCRNLVRGGAIPLEPGADPVAAFAEAIEG
jgi:DNA processing protein